ncbi:hypothetical protein GCM10009792_03840 [Microcella alkalica]|uniref:Uncharacterized protein n=1 Tax=Microcella alkalica TaxID=355930 RepID=A0A839EC08_9MICO|nr:hypothetical protein [Microcella alkalica]
MRKGPGFAPGPFPVRRMPVVRRARTSPRCAVRPTRAPSPLAHASAYAARRLPLHSGPDRMQGAAARDAACRRGTREKRPSLP